MKIFPSLLFSISLLAGAHGKVHAESAKRYGINLDNSKVCPAVNNALGQMLFVSVDGFGKDLNSAIHPDYVKLVKLLNLGGVLPRFGKKDPNLVFQSTQQLFAATDLPLLIGVDSTTVSYFDNNRQQNVKVGFGPGAGWMRHFDTANRDCFGQKRFLDAFLHKALGLNLSLGPNYQHRVFGDKLKAQKVDIGNEIAGIMRDYRNLAIKTTLRSFPYYYNTKSSTFLDKSAVLSRLTTLQQLAPKAEFVLTNHLFNPLIDRNDFVAWSRPWLNLLRKDIGFKGLVISDSRAFLSKNKDELPTLARSWLKRHPEDSPTAAYVAKTILAGHDIVLLQGVARDTIELFEDLSVMACRDDQDGKRLQYRIGESFSKIEKFKKANRGALSYRPSVDSQLLKDVLAYKHQLDSQQSCAASQSEDFTFIKLKQRIFEVH